MSVRLLAAAQAELDEAINWYEGQAPGLGAAFLLEAVKAFRRIEQYPDAWHPMTAEIRRCRLARFPYGVIYAQRQDGILILAVAHLHREPMHWRNR